MRTQHATGLSMINPAILESPSDVHLPPPDQADDPDDPEQAGCHQCEGTGPRAERHQPIREVEDEEDPRAGHEDVYEIKALVEDSVERSQGRRRPQQSVDARDDLEAGATRALVLRDCCLTRPPRNRQLVSC